MRTPQPLRLTLLYFFLLNLTFFFLQLMLVYMHSGTFIHAIPLTRYVYLELASTLCLHFGLYFLLSLLQSILFWAISKKRWHYFSPEQWQILIWSLFACAILSANAYYYPLSLFSRTLEAPLLLAKFAYACSSFLIILLSLNALWVILEKNTFVKIRYATTGFAVLLIGIVMTRYTFSVPQQTFEAKHMCMMMRGVEKQNSTMTTSVMLGDMRENANTRMEFLNLVG